MTVTPSEPGRFRRIIVGVDGSESSLRALEWAARQAELTGWLLEVITTWEWPTSYGWAFPLPSDYSPKVDAQTLVDGVVTKLRESHPKLDVTTAVVEGHPAPVLIDASRMAELLVVGSRGHGEFAGMLLGSVSEHCVTNAHCPVVVIRQEH
jgi:nucleotide-binding universal stress UspA family protein